jgi:hypothetical protein
MLKKNKHLFDHFEDIDQLACELIITGREKRDSSAGVVHAASGATDAMNVRVEIQRHVVVDHQFDILHICTTKTIN